MGAGTFIAKKFIAIEVPNESILVGALAMKKCVVHGLDDGVWNFKGRFVKSQELLVRSWENFSLSISTMRDHE